MQSSASLERGGEPRVGERLGALELARRRAARTGAAAAAASTVGASGPHDHERQPGVGAEQQPRAARSLVAPGGRVAVDAAQREPGAGVGQVGGAEQERGQPVGHLDLPVGERHRRRRATSRRIAPVRGSGAPGREAGEHVRCDRRLSSASRSAARRGLASLRVTSSCR